MAPDSICKIVCQYNQKPVPKGDMDKLLDIAQDYSRVKEYVCQRYGSVKSLSKIYPGYTVQNEMNRSGFREELGLPSVYFNLAVFDALKDIRSQWTRTKSVILERVGQNPGFSEEEKHYLRYVLKVSNAFDGILNCREVELRKDLLEQYNLLAETVDVKRLNSYLRRQARRIHRTVKVSAQNGFSMTERAYRYGEHGIYISTKEKRKRIFIPLTDNNRYTRQLYVKLFPKQGKVEIKVPVDVKIQDHPDYVEHVGIAVGMQAVIVTDRGNRYGERLWDYQIEMADWVRTQARRYHPNNEAESGRKKHMDQKHRMTERLHSYINMELNRFLKTEKPKAIYIPKLPRPMKHGGQKEINNSVNMWQRGYIRKRLQQKCLEQSVEFVEVFGKDIGRECSRCGCLGKKKDGRFICRACGYGADLKQNAAINAKNRGIKSDHKSLHLDE